MVLYIAIAAMTVWMASLVEKTAGMPYASRGWTLHRTGLFLIFLILLLPAVLRQETGNDYLRYVEFFHLASIDAYVPTEEGFNLLVKFIYNLCGYENYLLVFAVFAFMTIAMMLTALYQQSENFLFSFFLFMMFGYYFQSYNTMRYYFALSVVMVAVTGLLRKNYAAFVLLVLFASLFHKTALVALVLYPLALHVWKKWQILMAVLFGALVFVFHDAFMELLLVLYPSWEDTADLAAGTSVSWVNIARCAGALLLTFLVYVLTKKEKTGENLRTQYRENTWEGRQLRTYINGTALGLLIYVFGWFIPEVSRICYYLTITQVFLFPMLLRRIPKACEEQKKKLGILVVLAAMVYFAFFLRSAYGDTIKILPYKSFLFHDLNQTPSGSIE